MNTINKQTTGTSNKNNNNVKTLLGNLKVNWEKKLEIPFTSSKQVNASVNANWSKCYFWALFQFILKSFTSLNFDLSNWIGQLGGTHCLWCISNNITYLLYECQWVPFRVRCVRLWSLITIFDKYQPAAVFVRPITSSLHIPVETVFNENFHFICEWVFGGRLNLISRNFVRLREWTFYSDDVWSYIENLAAQK